MTRKQAVKWVEKNFAKRDYVGLIDGLMDNGFEESEALSIIDEANEIIQAKFLRNPGELTMAELQSRLSQYTGTEHWYSGAPLFPRFKYTDGVKAMAELAGAYWLIDLIFSHQITPRVRMEPFQIWTISAKRTRRGLGRGMAEMKTDTNQPVLARQRFSTDFPEGEFKLYFIDGVLLLPSEY